MACNSALVVHSMLWLETDFTYGLLDGTHKGSNPREICTALPESGAGSSWGIYALKHPNLMFEDGFPSFIYLLLVFIFQRYQHLLHLGKDGMLALMLTSGCSGYGATALWVLTEGGGVEACHWAGHEEVSDLSEGQQACWVVPLPLLLLDQAFQFLFEGLEKRREEH